MKNAQRLLVLAPHPDDEILGCGGTLALAARRGAQVHVLVAFDGASGDPDGRYDDQDYVHLRQQETRQGGARLGVGGYTFWGLPEGHSPGEADIEHGAQRLAEFVRDWKPDVILAPWHGDQHMDHQSLSVAVTRFLEISPFAGDVWGFEVWSPLQPELLVDVSSVWSRKVEALESHQTQLAYDDLVGRMTRLAERHEMGLQEAFCRIQVAA